LAYRVPDAVQRFSRCSAEPGPKNPSAVRGPRISSAPRRKSGTLRSIRGTLASKRRPAWSGPSNFSFD